MTNNHRPLRYILRLVILLLVAAATLGIMGEGVVKGTAPLQVSTSADASDTFSTSPSSLNITIPLGDQRSVHLTISNVTTTTLTPVLYEALPAPASNAATQAVEPSLQRVGLPEQASRVDERILNDLAASPDGRAEFLVFLNEQPDLSPAYSMADWEERGRFVYQTLYENAERSQRDLRAWLESRGIAYRPLWIANALAVSGTEADMQALESRQEVALLHANRVMALDDQAYEQTQEPEAVTTNCSPDENGTCWNISQIGADRAWYDFDISGQGITVASIDSGVRYDHVALVQQYRGYRNPGEFQHSYNWFDPALDTATPADAGNHGTHVMGTIIGRGDGSANLPAIGTAPGARWIAARSCGSSQCSIANILAAAQWMLAPSDENGDNPRPDVRPHVINNSWADDEGGEEDYTGFVTAWRAAGIFPVFAAGNGSRITCGSAVSPGDYEQVVGVGATDSNDLIASLSRSGPTLDGRLKPDISAPGLSVFSTIATSAESYNTFSGTSMAAPHVAGTVALMWSANPTLIGDYDSTYDLLTQSAEPRADDRFSDPVDYPTCQADSVPNNIYGYGRLDAYNAVSSARVDVPWLDAPGTIGAIEPGLSNTVNLAFDAQEVTGPGVYHARILVGTGDLNQPLVTVAVTMTVINDTNSATVSGNIEDALTGMPLRAVVDVTDGPYLEVDETGEYEVTLPVQTQPYTYTFRVSSTGYVTEESDIALRAGMQRTLDFALVPEQAPYVIRFPIIVVK